MKKIFSLFISVMISLAGLAQTKLTASEIKLDNSTVKANAYNAVMVDTNVRIASKWYARSIVSLYGLLSTDTSGMLDPYLTEDEASALYAPIGSYLTPGNNLSDVSSASTSRTNLGATTVGSNIFTLTNPSAISFVKIAADNSVSTRSIAQLKSDLSLDNVENTALSTWAGTTNITTLGTIGTGTWNASTIAINKGGTGQTTANAAMNALLPSKAGNALKILRVNALETDFELFTASGTGDILSDGSVNFSGQETFENGLTTDSITDNGNTLLLRSDTTIYIDGESIDANFYETFSIHDADGSYLFLDQINKAYQLGDVNSALNRTLLTVDDMGEKITTNADHGFYVNNYRLPLADGSIGQFIKTDGAGALSFSGITTTDVTGLGTAAEKNISFFLQVGNNLSDLGSASTARTNLGATDVGSNIFRLTNPSAISFIKIAADNSVSTRTPAQVLSDIGAQASGSYLITTNNLSDLSNASTARSNLGLGSAATQSSSTFLQAANNLSDVSNASTARSNLGLGSAATQASSTFLQAANNLSDVSNGATARGNLGATTIGTSFFTLTDPLAVTFVRMNADNTITARTASEMRTDLSLVAGTNVQAFDADLSTYAGITPSANVITMLQSANNAAIRSNIGLGTAATQNTGTFLLSANNLSDVTPSTGRTNLGATTVGGNIFTLTNPSAIRFIRINADNSVSSRTAAEILSDIGAQASGSYALTTNNLSDLSNAGTARTNLGATTVGSNIFTLTNPSAISFVKIAADNSVSTRTPSEVKTDLSLNNVENTALSTWAGTSSITTVGTITSGNVSAIIGGSIVANVSGSNFTTTNTTATDITGLSFAVGASETWEFTADIKVGSSSNAGIKIAVNTPASPTSLNAYVHGQVASNTALAEEEVSADATLTTTAFNTGSITTAAVGAFIHVRGFVVNGSNAGNVFIDIAKVTSGTATVYIGSHLRATRKS